MYIPLRLLRATVHDFSTLLLTEQAVIRVEKVKYSEKKESIRYEIHAILFLKTIKKLKERKNGEPNTHIHDRSHSCFGTVTLIKGGGVI